jgi:hypothetical protein
VIQGEESSLLCCSSIPNGEGREPVPYRMEEREYRTSRNHRRKNDDDGDRMDELGLR